MNKQIKKAINKKAHELSRKSYFNFQELLSEQFVLMDFEDESQVDCINFDIDFRVNYDE